MQKLIGIEYNDELGHLIVDLSESGDWVEVAVGSNVETVAGALIGLAYKLLNRNYERAATN